MREILFHGKRIDNGEWVEGGYYCEKIGEYVTAVFIVENLTSEVNERHRVIPETVGQYTGLTDKNGKKIFEGDIVRTGDITHDGKVQIPGGNFLVDMQRACWIIEHCPDWGFLCTNARSCEIIGNIHDNPELLEVSEDE